MGIFDRLRGREKFSQWNASNPAFAEWWLGSDVSSESVTQYTIWGLSAVMRSVQILCTIAGLPLRSYERQGDEKVRLTTVFDDPYPGLDGMTPFAWTETIVIHLALWRRAFLWRELDATGAEYFRPIHPDLILKIYRDSAGRKKFEYKDENHELQTADSTQVVHIPGPSMDGLDGYPLIAAAKAVFSAAISGDKQAQRTLRRGIRIGGLVTPGDGEEDFEPEEGEAILESLRSKVMGSDNAGDIALINKRLKLQPWTANNVESQWIETKNSVLGDIERLFGVPPHLLADTEKQTSWGTGVAEQNLGLARYTLRNWSDRIEQVLSQRLPDGQFCEFEYAGLLQGTPADEIALLIDQVEAGLLTVDEARQIRNLPPLTPSQKAQQALRALPAPVTDEVAA